MNALSPSLVPLTAFANDRRKVFMSQSPTISFVSLGCSKNLVDSERMLGLLGQEGYVLVPESQTVGPRV